MKKLLITLLFLFSQNVFATSMPTDFAIFGDGSDGDFAPAAGTITWLTPSYRTYGPIIKQYNSFALCGTCTLTSNVSTTGMYIFVRGTATITGVTPAGRYGGITMTNLGYSYGGEGAGLVLTRTSNIKTLVINVSQSSYYGSMKGGDSGTGGTGGTGADGVGCTEGFSGSAGGGGLYVNQEMGNITGGGRGTGGGSGGRCGCGEGGDGRGHYGYPSGQGSRGVGGNAVACTGGTSGAGGNGCKAPGGAFILIARKIVLDGSPLFDIRSTYNGGAGGDATTDGGGGSGGGGCGGGLAGFIYNEFSGTYYQSQFPRSGSSGGVGGSEAGNGVDGVVGSDGSDGHVYTIDLVNNIFTQVY